LIVLDADALAGSGPPLNNDWQGIPQVIIGTIHVAEPEAATGQTGEPERRYLQKPFQFAELMRAIDALLPSRR
jgi:hypothetical protein